MGHDVGAITTLSRAECLSLLERVPLGRVGVSIGALPVILPVNFALFEGSILIRTVPGTKLDAATVGAVVAFEADAYDPEQTSGWSVLVVGKASEITDQSELVRARNVPLHAWGLGDRAQHFMRIATTEVSGRCIPPTTGRHREVMADGAGAHQIMAGDLTR